MLGISRRHWGVQETCSRASETMYHQLTPASSLRAMSISKLSLNSNLHRAALFYWNCMHMRKAEPKGTCLTSLPLTSAAFTSSETSVSSSWKGRREKNKRTMVTDILESNKVSSHQLCILAFQTQAVRTDCQVILRYCCFNSHHRQAAQEHFLSSNKP